MASTGDPMYCAGCGAYGTAYLCHACQYEMNTYVASHKDDFDAAMREDAIRSAGGPMSERMRDLEAENKDLKDSIRELQGWADEKYNKVVDRLEKTIGTNIRATRLEAQKSVYAEVGEHCAVALEDNK